MDTAALEYRRITAPPAMVHALPALDLPPRTAPRVITTSAPEDDPLPNADVLVVTYTKAEGMALADVLTPGVHSDDWTVYKNGWPALRQLVEGGRAPSLHTQASGSWALISIGDLRVVLMKSDLHPATDGPRLPIAKAWAQWVQQVGPRLVITTGTAGAVQDTTELGDVVVSRTVGWDCRRRFKNASFAGQTYTSPLTLDRSAYEQVAPLLRRTVTGLPDVTRPPVIWLDDDVPAHVITTDFFAFDDAEGSYWLRGFDPYARAVEMDDAAMAFALGDTVPWLIIRNASDPQMPAQASVEDEAKAASRIYEHWGQVTSWGSALSCWATIAALTS